MEHTFFKFKCTSCGYSDEFTDMEEASKYFIHTTGGVKCDECDYLEYPHVDRMLNESDAVDTWTEEFYDEMQADERRAERSEL